MRHARRLVPALAVAVALAWCTGPVLWQLVTALKSTEELYRVPPGWLPASPTLEHFARVFDGHPFGRNLLNSAVVAGASALAALAFGSLAAYGLAILRIPGTRLVLGAAACVVVTGLVSSLVFSFGAWGEWLSKVGAPGPGPPGE